MTDGTPDDGLPPAKTGRWAGGFVSLLFLALAVTIVVLAVPKLLGELAPSWRAASGDGVAGTFTAAATYEVGPSGRPARVWEGTFVSDDGTVVHHGVRLAHPPDDMAVGTTVAALDTGAAGVVYRTGFDGPLLGNVICLTMIGCPLLVLAIPLVRVPLRWLRRRSAPPRDPPDTFQP